MKANDPNNILRPVLAVRITETGRYLGYICYVSRDDDVGSDATSRPQVCAKNF